MCLDRTVIAEVLSYVDERFILGYRQVSNLFAQAARDYPISKITSRTWQFFHSSRRVIVSEAHATFPQSFHHTRTLSVGNANPVIVDRLLEELQGQLESLILTPRHYDAVRNDCCSKWLHNYYRLSLFSNLQILELKHPGKIDLGSTSRQIASLKSLTLSHLSFEELETWYQVIPFLAASVIDLSFSDIATPSAESETDCVWPLRSPVHVNRLSIQKSREIVHTKYFFRFNPRKWITDADFADELSHVQFISALEVCSAPLKMESLESKSDFCICLLLNSVWTERLVSVSYDRRTVNVSSELSSVLRRCGKLKSFTSSLSGEYAAYLPNQIRRYKTDATVQSILLFNEQTYQCMFPIEECGRFSFETVEEMDRVSKCCPNIRRFVVSDRCLSVASVGTVARCFRRFLSKGPLEKLEIASNRIDWVSAVLQMIGEKECTHLCLRVFDRDFVDQIERIGPNFVQFECTIRNEDRLDMANRFYRTDITISSNNSVIRSIYR